MRYIILFIFSSFSAFSFENCVSENMSDIEQCSMKNFKEEDVKLNYLYKEIINTYPELKKDINTIQKKWIKARDSVCTYNLTDGEEYKIYQNSCLYQQTYERNRELEAIILKESNISNHDNKKPNQQWDGYIKSHCDFMQSKYSDNGCVTRNNFLHSKE